MIERKQPATKEATMAKLFATEAAVKVTDTAIQILGGEGYVKDYSGIEKFYRDARLGTIGGGTSEIMRFLIQREIYIEQKRGKAKGIQEVEVDFSTMMAYIPQGFRPARAEGVTATIQFEFSDANAWLLNIQNQECHVEESTSNKAIMTVKTDSITWRNIMLGKLDAMQAMMSGKVNITTDDMDLLLKFARMFKFSPEIFSK
jgi:putative sterol carrier protein